MKIGQWSSSPVLLNDVYVFPSNGEGSGDGDEVGDSVSLLEDLDVVFVLLELELELDASSSVLDGGGLLDSVPPLSSFSGRGSRFTSPTSLEKWVICSSGDCWAEVVSSEANVKTGIEPEAASLAEEARFWFTAIALAEPISVAISNDCFHPCFRAGRRCPCCCLCVGVTAAAADCKDHVGAMAQCHLRVCVLVRLTIESSTIDAPTASMAAFKVGHLFKCLEWVRLSSGGMRSAVAV